MWQAIETSYGLLLVIMPDGIGSHTDDLKDEDWWDLINDVPRTCEKESEIMRHEDWEWSDDFTEQCYFYPGRDCPGNSAGGICGRIGRVIPDD